MDPIIIIEDDRDDQDIIKTTLTDLEVKNPLVFFENGEKAFIYLSRPDVTPFLIFSDVNMPGINGFQLRDKIHEDAELRIKCIPYLFLTTGGENKYVWEAYSRNAQGFFIKPSSMGNWKKLFYMIIHYWENSRIPRP
jgi:CheY-like chemotaxis protein